MRDGDAGFGVADKGIGSSGVYFETRSTIPVSTFLTAGGVRLLAIVGEPGMGKSALLERVLETGRTQGLKVLRMDVGGLAAEEAGEALSRFATTACKSAKAGGVVVGIDDIPASDEWSCKKMTRAVERMIAAGCAVVLTMLPECRTILELLPAATVLQGEDLLVRMPDVPGGSAGRSGGVYALSRALVLAPERGGAVPVAYYDALRYVVAGAVRRGLMDEETRIRLAMVLLGAGRLSTLREALDDADEELLHDVSQDAPFFGVDFSAGAFRCRGLGDNAALEACFGVLLDVAREYADVCVACARILGESGDFGRMALLCDMLPDDPRMLGIAAAWGTELLDLGRVRVVRQAISSSDVVLRKETRATLEAAVAAVSERNWVAEDHGVRDREEVTPDSPLGANLDGDQGCAARLFVLARRALAAPIARLGPVGGQGALVERLGTHLVALALIAGGKSVQVLRMLSAHPAGDPRESVSGALVCLDGEMARLLCAARPIVDEPTLEAAHDVLESPEATGLEAYSHLARVWREAILGDGRACGEVDVLISKTERQKDLFAHLCALLAGVVLDLRAGSCTRARVRADLTVELAARLGLGYFEELSRVLSAASLAALGERPVPADGQETWESPALAAMHVLVCRCADAGRDACEAFPLEMPADAPPELLWLLVVLADCPYDFSRRLRSTVPQGWLVALGEAERLLGTNREARAQDLPAEVGLPQCPVRVCLLGDFSVEVCGRPVPEWNFDRRQAKSMLVYLLLMRYHRARRFQIVEQVFPDSDYDRGRKRVYQTTNLIREIIASEAPGIDPLVSVRGAQSLAIRAEAVSCDVDEFVSLAKRIVDSDDDAACVAQARRVEELYQGDLFMPPRDGTGFVAKMRDRLRTLYADAMVCGAEAALRQGQARTAARLAENATFVDDMREDVVVILIRALRASGRMGEADRRYRRYTRELVQQAKRPPSKQVRIAAMGTGMGLPGAEGVLMGAGTRALPVG